MISNSDTLVQDTQTKIPATDMKFPQAPIGTVARPPTQTAGTSLEQILRRPTSAISDFGRLLRPNRSSASPRPTSPPRGDNATQSLNPDARAVSLPPNPKGVSQPPSKGSGGPNITPLRNICMFCESDAQKRHLILHFCPANNIDMAISACAPERSNLLRNREEMQMVKESLDEGYCDVSGRAGELNLIGMCLIPLCETFPDYHLRNFAGSMGGVKVYAAQGTIASPEPTTVIDPQIPLDLPESESLIQRKHDVLARFLHVLNPLVAIYKIPQASLHVFADNEGQLIAFNRNGSLFMNLRFYEAWRTYNLFTPGRPTATAHPFHVDDRDVQRGDFSKAYISWYGPPYFSLNAWLMLPRQVLHSRSRDCPQSCSSPQL